MQIINKNYAGEYHLFASLSDKMEQNSTLHPLHEENMQNFELETDDLKHLETVCESKEVSLVLFHLFHNIMQIIFSCYS